MCVCVCRFTDLIRLVSSDKRTQRIIFILSKIDASTTPQPNILALLIKCHLSHRLLIIAYYRPNGSIPSMQRLFCYVCVCAIYNDKSPMMKDERRVHLFGSGLG